MIIFKRILSCGCPFYSHNDHQSKEKLIHECIMKYNFGNRRVNVIVFKKIKSKYKSLNSLQ